MPYIETPNDLAEHLADLLGIYTDPRCAIASLEILDSHVDDCVCRVWWVPNMSDRIRQAVQNEHQLEEVARQEAIERHGTLSPKYRHPNVQCSDDTCWCQMRPLGPFVSDDMPDDREQHANERAEKMP